MSQAFRRAFVIGCIVMFGVNLLVWWLSGNASLATTTLIAPPCIGIMLVAGAQLAVVVGRRTLKENETRENGDEEEDRSRSESQA